jgi:putative membrane protein
VSGIFALQLGSSPYDWQWEHIWVPVLLAGVYLLCAGPLRSRFPGSSPVSAVQAQLFLSGALLLFISVVSPLETLSGYLLSMHMVQHLVLTMLVAPLLLVGTPGWMLRPLLRLPLALPVARVLTHPLTAFLLFNAIFTVWHAPSFYDLALRDPNVHRFEHAMFLAAALLTWWPVFSPLDELPRMADPPLLLYLFFESLPPTILGALITFAGDILYPSYAAAPRMWGLSAALDQQMGGLIMWIPGALVYFAVLTWVFFRWMNRDEYQQSQDVRRPALEVRD